MAFNINNRRYTGSKFKISEWIRKTIINECGENRSFCDLFAGTAVVTNAVVNDFKEFYVNDLLYSNKVIYEAFFGKKDFSEEKLMKFYKKYRKLDINSIDDNYVSKNYGDKFFSLDDAKLIGFIRQDIENNKMKVNIREYNLLLASLLYSLDRCANTVGHYDAYFKKGIIRSLFHFELIKPVVKSSNDERVFHISRDDANYLAKKIKVDVVYIDPPYSSRQYSRFYHVLETIVKWDKPVLYGSALKPEPENMSEYSKTKAIDFFKELIYDIKARYIIVSYNNTYASKSKSSANKMTLEEIHETLSVKGKTTVHSIEHQAFNAGKTDFKGHKEYLFVTKVGELDE